MDVWNKIVRPCHLTYLRKISRSLPCRYNFIFNVFTCAAVLIHTVTGTAISSAYIGKRSSLTFLPFSLEFWIATNS